MMRGRLLELAERRARLVARAQADRESVARLLAATDGFSSIAASVVRMARGALNQALQHPLFAAAGLLVFLVLRPRRAIAWLAKGWSLWRLFRSAQGVWLRLAATAGTQPPPGRYRQ